MQQLVMLAGTFETASGNKRAMNMSSVITKKKSHEGFKNFTAM
jgi:hypothetical protein